MYLYHSWKLMRAHVPHELIYHSLAQEWKTRKRLFFFFFLFFLSFLWIIRDFHSWKQGVKNTHQQVITFSVAQLVYLSHALSEIRTSHQGRSHHEIFPSRQVGRSILTLLSKGMTWFLGSVYSKTSLLMQGILNFFPWFSFSHFRHHSSSFGLFHRFYVCLRVF